jgi:hypothetical protein
LSAGREQRSQVGSVVWNKTSSGVRRFKRRRRTPGLRSFKKFSAPGETLPREQIREIPVLERMGYA